MDVAADRRVGPDLDHRAVGADPGHRQRRRDIDVGRETAGGLAGGAGEDQLRLAEAGDADLVLDEIGRAFEPAGRLAGDHLHRFEAAAHGRRLHRVERQERAGRHQDAPALPARQLNEVEIVEKRAAAQHDNAAAMRQNRLGEIAQILRRRAFDDDVGVFPQPLERQHRNGCREARDRRFGAGSIARRDRGEAQPLDPTIQRLGHHLADRPEPANRDAQNHDRLPGRRYCGSPSMINSRVLAERWRSGMASP